MIKRLVQIEQNLEANKVVIIYGSRQVGKTTLVKDFLKDTFLRYKYFTGNQLDFIENFANCNLDTIKKLLAILNF